MLTACLFSFLILVALVSSSTVDYDPSLKFQVRFVVNTGRGKQGFTVETMPQWAPLACKRFRELIESEFYIYSRFHRVLQNHVAQFGINGKPELQAEWGNRTLPEETRVAHNLRGYMGFTVGGGLDTRATQIYINLKDNPNFDIFGLTPFAKILLTLDDLAPTYNAEPLEKLVFYYEYGDAAPFGEGPDQFRIMKEGNKYLKKEFPKLSYISKLHILEGANMVHENHSPEGKDLPQPGLNPDSLKDLMMTEHEEM